MFDFHEKRKMRVIFYSVPFIGFVFILALLMLWSTYGRFVTERDMAKKLTDKEASLGELQQRANALQAKVSHLESERGVEEELRNRFDVVKEGEQAVIILNDTNKSTTSSSSLQTLPSAQSHPWYEVLKFW